MALTELGIEGNYLNIVKTIYGVLMSNNHNKWGKTKTISSEIKSKAEESALLSFSNNTLDMLANTTGH